MDQLEGKVAVVTGGGSGIGQGIVGACAQAGMRVVVSDIELDAAERVADAARETGGEAIAVQADVADGLAMDALAERTYEAFGAAHLLCNHAGVIIETPIVERTDGDWEWLFRVNVMGVVHGIQAFVPRMREHAAHAPRHDEPDDRGGRSERGRDRGVLLHVVQATAALPLEPIAAGRYADRFERVDGRWRFAHRRSHLDLQGRFEEFRRRDD